MRSTTTVSGHRVASGVGVLIIAWFVSSLEGYDLAIWGASVPLIMRDGSFGLTVPLAGTIGSLVGFGMLLGAALAGAVVHQTGQRRLILIGIGVFSVGMLVCAAASGPNPFGFGRFVVGFGLGIVLPTITAYVADMSAADRVAQHVGLIMSGYAVGALCAPLLANWLQDFSFRWLYVIGVVPAVVMVPFVHLLPENPAHLWRMGRRQDALALIAYYGLAQPEQTPVVRPGRLFGLGALFVRGIWWPTLLFWVLSFCGLLLVFGISAWLPTMMQRVGYGIGSALLLTAVMWIGVIVGSVGGGRLADIIGAQKVVVMTFAIGTICLVLMSLNPPTWVLYVLMFFSGFGFVGSQIMGNALIVTRYPDALRSNGLSWALCVGRLGAITGPSLGALVMTSGLPVQWNFYAFAIPASLGALATILIPGIRSASH